MRPAGKRLYVRRHGVALIVSMIFLLIFTSLAVSIASFSGTNVQLAENQRRANNALTSAHSGLEVLRYYLSPVTVPGSVTPANRLSSVASALQTVLINSGVSNVTANYDASTATINITSVSLSTSAGQSFTAKITQPDADTLQMDIFGVCRDATRHIRTSFSFVTIGSGVFDYGVATKGPLAMSGQTSIDDVNIAVEANVYIEGNNTSGDAFNIAGQASVSGDVTIANQYATYSLGDKCIVGGAQGAAANDHVHVGAPYVEFPTPNPEYFRHFATGEVIDSHSSWGNKSTLSNVLIKANTNPTFTSSVKINGILFIELPNSVNFAGKAEISGMIVAAGDRNNELPGCNISFAGQVVSHDAQSLTGSQYDAIKQEKGTFILAPGFSLDFSGQAMHMNGAIAANGISFSGQAGGTINGSLINYSQKPVTLSGQSNLTFNRSGRTTDPSGFSPDQTLVFQPTSYSELPN